MTQKKVLASLKPGDLITLYPGLRVYAYTPSPEYMHMEAQQVWDRVGKVLHIVSRHLATPYQLLDPVVYLSHAHEYLKIMTPEHGMLFVPIGNLGIGKVVEP